MFFIDLDPDQGWSLDSDFYRVLAYAMAYNFTFLCSFIGFKKAETSPAELISSHGL